MHEIETKSGTIVACFLKNYEDEEPQLGCVTQFNKGDLDVELEWMLEHIQNHGVSGKKERKTV